ncbi:MAG: hypothetical protein QOH60_2332 [Mycobacterium sp.]|jgi:hypothetical protein|nr:hypothetical protein [Mycobacterium sp.]
MEQLSPVLQQAASNPQNAASMLMAAASAFAGNSSVPADSRQVATSVNQFVQGPGGPGQPPATPGQQNESLIPSAQVTMPGAIPGVPLPLPHNLSVPADLNKLLPPGLQLPSPDAAVPGATPPGPKPSGPLANSASPTGPAIQQSAANAPPRIVPHLPPPGVTPGEDPHLPTGIDPANAVGPAPGDAPAPAPAAVPDSSPLAAPAPPAPAPDAAPGAGAPASPAPEASPPAPAPAPSPPAPAPSAAPAFGPDSPPTQEFMYPSIGNACLADGGNVIATAISVAGPASIPKPGPLAGQTAYVFTAIGTPGPAAEQRLPLNVTWVNLTNGKSGSATLKPSPEINPDGPTTLIAIADTGSGSIMSTIFGQVTTVDKQCTFMPTIGSTVVP